MQKARKWYEGYINKKVHHHLEFRTGDWVYIDKPFTLKIEQTESVAQNPSRKRYPKKNGLFGVSRVRNRTKPVDVNGIQNVLFIDRTTLARTAKEAMSALEEERQYNVQNNEINTSNNEHVDERIVPRKDEDRETKYLVQ